MLWFVELTDTFCGELNYSWVKRFSVKAKTIQSAMRKVSIECGTKTRKICESGDCATYKVIDANMAFTIEPADIEWVGMCSGVKEI